MIRKILILCVLTMFVIACNNTQNPSTDAEKNVQEPEEELVTLSIADFDEQAANYVGKEVQISGLVNHTCKHGGKRMFIIDEETEQTVKVEAGENIASFNADLEGSDVLVTGIVNELIIDEAYLHEWEEEIKEEMSKVAEEGEEPEHAEGEEEGDTEHLHSSGGLGEKADMGEHINDLEKIESYRNQIKESGKDHLAFYSIECNSYEILPTDKEN